MIEAVSGPDERQIRVIKALEERSPRLAGMYKSALSMLQTEPEAGCEAARVSVICHCMRELMTGLPAAMSDSIVPRPKPSSGSLVSKLPKLLADNPEVDLSIDQDIIPVPNAVAKALSDLVAAATQEAGRNRSNTAALVTGGGDPKHPAIDQWLDVYQFFLGWTHLDRNHEEGRALPDNREILAAMRIVEDIIEVRTRLFFENVQAVQELLDEINAFSDEDE